GETFIDQRIDWNPRFTFTDKEKDRNTGYHFPIAIGIGARYYDSEVSVWLSVDPMAFKYPDQSPYSYVGNRPINTIDPWGMDEYKDPNGNTGNSGDGYKQTKDKKYLYGDGLKTKVWDPDYTVEDGGSGQADPYSKGGYVDYEGDPIDFDTYGKPGDFEKTVLNDDNWRTQAPNWSACFTTCAKIVGYTPQKSNAIYTTRENGNSLQVLPTNNEGIKTIDSYLKAGNPIVVGVNHTLGNTYNEGTTDHFVVIMGYGMDNGRRYYRFFDVGTRRISAGASPQNRFYFWPA
ncbi:MAG: RHS repeat-associated core domain-containing protein, partial [Bacteroidota bacterium]